jgi:hypothetical protein
MGAVTDRIVLSRSPTSVAGPIAQEQPLVTPEEKAALSGSHWWLIGPSACYSTIYMDGKWMVHGWRSWN